jgi:hypothetical protein
LEILRNSTENLRIFGVPAEIPTQHLQNGNQMGYSLPELALCCC